VVASQAQPVVVAAIPMQPRAQTDQQLQPAPRAATSPQPATRPVVSTAEGAFVVQVAALRSFDRAQRVASSIGGQVSQTGSLYRIRTGPFATRGQAEASLAKVRAAGYSDARIFTNG
jgi:rare lipoprotein A